MKCCICGAVKNCSQYLDKIFMNIEQVASLFEDYVIILCYGNSEDDTLEKLKEYQKKNDKLKLYVNKNDNGTFRTHRIANARNKYLDMIRNNFSDYEMFVVMDCDNVCSSYIKLEILKKYLYRSDWDALSFNRDDYYDTWALSIKPYIFSYRHYNNESIVLENTKLYIKNLLSKVPNNGLLKCASAFNGFAIYRTNKFINCSYDGRPRFDLIPKNYIINNVIVNNSKLTFSLNKGTEQTVHEDCEHRAFHLEAINKNGARIRISPEILFD